MPLLARLRAYAAEALGVAGSAEPVDDTHLAATALLVHVARVDGVLAPAESDRLARLVQGRYAADPEAARALVGRASAFDAETRDVADLVEMIPHGMDEIERERLLAMAWAVAGADGEVGEFEEALVWRLGALLGLDEAAIARARTCRTPDGVTPDRITPDGSGAAR
ncbi:TerB family tellurite resistance protein [Methylobacterium radiodurans]|uniref:Tellurite resistance protein TerB n=1 Tax=Methylobacterium radiodurans TaxID=2202828 RepID=A0A2U8VRE1_9HYPH|nr:TerB family tellurite resistance protein [Methylobacterium radiodurans]AWN36030.1 Tellurite resistance protein TerB [Methylobacterium radiodurans]